MLDTILFDLDGTLLPFVQDEFIHAYLAALVRRLAPRGYEKDAIVSAVWAGTGAMLKNDGCRPNREAFWEVFTHRLGPEAGDLERDLEDFYRGDFDGVRAVLRQQADRGPLVQGLREKGYRVVLATNPVFPAVAVETRLRWVGLEPGDFELVTTYENSRHSKPSPAYYRDILAAVGRAPEACLMVGNSPADDMAARQVGLSVYLVTDYLENPDQRPIDEYPHGSFAQLEEQLEALPTLLKK